MAISIKKQPDSISFSGNPIVFELESNVINGVVFSGELDRGKLWATGKRITFIFGSENIEMTQSENPDNSGTQFGCKNKSGIFLTAAEIVPYFIANNTLNKYFIIEAKDQEKILFRARKVGTSYNWQPNSDLTINTLGADPKENPKFLFEVYFRTPGAADFENIYSEELIQDSSFSGGLSIDISRILDVCLLHEIPDLESLSPQVCTKSKGEYYCRFSEMFGTPPRPQKGFQSDIKYVIKGGFSHIGFKNNNINSYFRPDINDPSKDLFLKQGPRIIQKRNEQPEWLYFLNLRANTKIRLKTNVVYTDASTADVFSNEITVKRYDKIRFPGDLSFPKSAKVIKEYSCHLVDQDNKPVSEKITYQIDNKYREQVRYFAYSSSLGGIDLIAAHGRGTQEYELNGQSIVKPLKPEYTLSDSSRINFNLKLQRTFTVTTGWLEKRQFNLLADFFIADKKFIISNRTALPITVTNKKGGEYHDSNPLIAQAFEYRYDFEDDSYTEGDEL